MCLLLFRVTIAPYKTDTQRLLPFKSFSALLSLFYLKSILVRNTSILIIMASVDSKVRINDSIDNHKCITDKTLVVICRDIDSVREKQVRLFPAVSDIICVLNCVAPKTTVTDITIILGGAGHEPTAIGYVGNGMLSAAVSGNLFASPSPRQILAAIRLCQSPHGTLLVVKNYTGDVLNFGLARERAVAEGIRVEMVVVGDDCAVGKAKGGLVGRRGLAGAIVVHKIVGALAARGELLDTILATAKNVISNLSTVGVALEPCYVPGADNSNARKLKPNEIELGMGIHGEPGCERMLAMVTATEETDSDRAFVSWSKENKDSVVVLVNNLGGTSVLELSAFTNDVVELAEQKGLSVKRIYSGPIITALNTPGVSITLFRLGDSNSEAQLLGLLDAPNHATGWLHAAGYNKNVLYSFTDSSKNTKVVDNNVGDNPLIAKVIRKACESVINAEPEITRLDTITGDGDCGHTLKSGANAILSALDASTLSLAPLDKLAIGIADILEDSMGGTSGALYCIYFNALATYFASSTTSDKKSWQSAASVALQQLQRYTAARKGDRTMLDALIPFVEEFDQGATLSKAVDAARQGMDATITMQPKLGRATYVGNLEHVNEVDAGAYGVVSILDGLQSALADL
ncbi:Dak1 domain-containing protein [Syncephalis fuscata]|nr:Dak1 domain-containing protein [Syncephalis fuscata]